MEKSTLGHLVVNIQEPTGVSTRVYSIFLGWKLLIDDPKMLGVEVPHMF